MSEQNTALTYESIINAFETKGSIDPEGKDAQALGLLLTDVKMRDALLVSMNSSETLRTDAMRWWETYVVPQAPQLKNDTKSVLLTFLAATLLIEDRRIEAAAAVGNAVNLAEGSPTSFLRLLDKAMSANVPSSVFRNSLGALTVEQAAAGADAMRVEGPRDLAKRLGDIVVLSDKPEAIFVAVADSGLVMSATAVPLNTSWTSDSLTKIKDALDSKTGLVVIYRNAGLFAINADAVQETANKTFGPDVNMLDIMTIDNNRMRSLLCEDEECCPTEGTPIA